MSISTSDSASTLGKSPEETEAAPTAGTGPRPPAPHPLPEQPVASIGPPRPWWSLDLRELWYYRELLYFLAWRDIKVRYKQTLMGVAWVVLQPLLSTLIFTIFLGKLARVPSDGAPYPLFVFAGLLPWTFFSAAVTGSGQSLVANAHLVTKVYFPRMFIPASSVCARLIDFLISLAVLAAMALYYGVPLTWRALVWLPPLTALTALLALGVGMWFAAVNVRYRDVGVVLPVLVQFWMFASPVVYPAGLVPEQWKRLYSLNPLVGIIEGFRSAIFGRPVDVMSLAFSAAVTLAALLCSAYAFRRMEKSFADLV